MDQPRGAEYRGERGPPVGNVIHSERTRLDDEEFGWLVGRSLSAIKFAEPDSWWFELSGGGSFSTHGGTWRLSSPERMLACSDDHLHPFGLPAPFDALRTAREAIGNASVVGARVRDRAPNLEIRLSNGLILEVLAFSLGYESWETCDPAGRCVVVNGSRDASTWKT